MYNAWTAAIEATPELTKNEKALVISGRDVCCVVLDEDLHYLLRQYYFLQKLFERRELLGIDQLHLEPVFEIRHDNGPQFKFEEGEGLLVHKVIKACIIPALGIASLAVARKARRQSWNTIEAQVFREILIGLMELDEIMRSHGPDHIRQVYAGIRDVCSVLIEDNKRINRFAANFMIELFRREPGFREEMNKANRIFSWEHDYAAIQADEARIRAGIPREPDIALLRNDPERYRHDAEEELKSLKGLKDKDV